MQSLASKDYRYGILLVFAQEFAFVMILNNNKSTCVFSNQVKWEIFFDI